MSILSLRGSETTVAISDLLGNGQPEIAASVFSLLAKTKKDHPFQSLRSWSKAQAVAISDFLSGGQPEIASHRLPSFKYAVRRTGS